MTINQKPAVPDFSTDGRGDLELHISYPIKVALQTVGCKLNQAESEAVARGLVENGCQMVSPEENPHVFILNTCTVTHIADRKCRQYIRSFNRQNPDALVLVAGCYVERSASQVRLEGVDMVLGNAEKDRLPEIIGRHFKPEKRRHHEAVATSISVQPRSRAMVNIQTGCSYGCTYCIVPGVRGVERSVPTDSVVAEVKNRVSEGCKEVVLTGTRIGAYASHGGLEELVKRILSETSIVRLRLSSIQPNELSPSLLQMCSENERICRHLHMALQSGSDPVLKRMGRGYTTKVFKSTVADARKAIPDVAITTDIIVGFPGESQREFEHSYQFCEEIGFSGVHIFQYSARPGTSAAYMSGSVPAKIKKARSLTLLELAERSAANFRHKFTGNSMPVLWENSKGENIWMGHTSNYLKVMAKSDKSLADQIIMTKLGQENGDSIWGEIC